MSDFDAIVIGAGNAGLTAAATMQRAGIQTLLVERHNVPGGCGTSFRRGRFEFEVGLHQLSGVGAEEREGASLRTLFDGLGIGDRLEFVQDSELYRAVVPGQYDLTLPADWDGAADAVEQAFPGNGDRVQRFFALIKQVAYWRIAAMRGVRAERLDPVLFRYGLRPTKEVLDEHFDDARLKSALSIYWTYLGQPPSRLVFQDFALMMFGYLEFQPWHVRGGSQAMSTAILDAFHDAGGTALFNTAVSAILTRGGAVAGVRLENGQEVGAADVISNISLPLTYGMLDPAIVPATVRNDLGTRRVGVSAFVLYMGLDGNPADLGLTAGSTFVCTDLDDDATFAAMRTLAPARGTIITCYDHPPIGFSPPGTTHATLMTLQYGDLWERLAPADYATTKFGYAQTLLDQVEHVSPGIRDAIEEVDVATPLTVTRYLGHPGGAIYGYDQDATESWLFRDSERRIHIPGLHLAGSWAGPGGFQPTLEAGARVARRLVRAKAA